MKRRAFITLLGGAAASLPLASRAQQADRVRRIGVLVGAGADGLDAQARQGAFLQGLQQLGWTDGRNVRIDTRWGGANADNAPVERLLQATRTMPIVFVFAIDQVGSGIVDSLSQPGGNATGFMQFEYSLTAKWLELLKQIAPGVTRAAVLRDAAVAASSPSSSPWRHRSAWR